MPPSLPRSLWFVLIPLLLVSAGLAAFAHAAPEGGVVGTGPGTCNETTLRAGMAGGGNVTFNCGASATILVLNSIVITAPTTINGGNKITVTGGLAGNILHANAGISLALRDIILDAGNGANGSGGALFAGGPLTLTHVMIQNSQTSIQYCGGGLIAASNTLITGSTFNNNKAGLGGGAICVRGQPNTKVQVTNSSFIGNQAVGTDPNNGLGGALYIEYGRADVLDSLFLFNSGHFGGAAYVSGVGGISATLTMQGTPTSSPYASPMQLNGNSTIEDGGAVYNKNGNVRIDNVVISANRTPTNTILAGYGGALYNEGAMTLTHAIVSQNEGRFGGAMFVGGNPNGARAVIDHVQFAFNLSGVYGGALYANTMTTSVTISNTAFNYNTAIGNGGGLARVNAGMRIANSSFTHNTAGAGGGLWIGALPSATDGPYVRVENSTISDNSLLSGATGGGILNTGLAEFYYLTIVTNTNGVHTDGGANTRFRDTVLQNPGFLNCDGDNTGSIADDGWNYSADNSCPLPNGNSHSGTGLDPKLGPLMLDSSGPNITYYRVPRADSPLINIGGNCPVRDQRGALRVNACDIGAIEYLIPLFLPMIQR